MGLTTLRRVVARVGRVVRLALVLPWRMLPYLAHPVESVRMFCSADMRRAFPHERESLMMRVAGLVALTAALAALLVPIVRLIVLGALVVELGAVVWYRWHNGARRLRRRGLPPGQLGILPTSLIEPGYLARRVERYGPVVTTNTLSRPTVAVAGLERGIRLLRDQRESLTVPGRPDSLRVEGGFVRNQHGDTHRTTRAALGVAFAPRVIDELQPMLQATIARHLDAWASDDAARAGGLELYHRVEALVLSAWITAFFGVDELSEADLHAEFAALFRMFDYMNPDEWPTDQATRLASAVRTQAALTAALPTCSLRALAERMPDRVDDPVVLGNLVHLVHTSRQDVSGLVTWLIYQLAKHPSLGEQVRSAGPGTDHASSIVSETLRLGQTEYVFRATKCPIDIEGYRIPANWFVRIMVRESHRDPEVFNDPDSFDPQRFAGGIPRDQFSPFGLDHRSCIGESLTRTMGELLVHELSADYRLGLASDGPPIVSRFRFWAPSLDVRVTLERTPR